MPTILAVADFSESSNAAVHYAAAFALDHRYDLHLLHTYVLPISIGDQTMPLMGIAEMEGIARNGMDKMVADVRTAYPGLQISQQITYGDWRDVVTDDKTSGYALIIVGSDGDEDSWMGSDTQDAALSADWPVLVVPPAKKYGGLRTICLACDAAAMQSVAILQSLIPILKNTGARLELLHVNTGAADAALWNRAIIDPALAGLAFSLNEVTAAAANVDSAIHDFALARGADWLALIPHHYSFFEGLFHKSHTRAAIRPGDVPVLSLH